MFSKRKKKTKGRTVVEAEEHYRLHRACVSAQTVLPRQTSCPCCCWIDPNANQLSKPTKQKRKEKQQ
jgi:hypothetical protein